VIKDLEAAQFVAKQVAARGLIVDVYKQEQKTFINFGTNYSNQPATSAFQLQG